MEPNKQVTIVGLSSVGLGELRRRWGWFVGLGALLILFGMIAIGAAAAMTTALMLVLGCLMIVGGALQGMHAFSCRGWSGFFIELLTGLLYVVVGGMVVANPPEAAAALTLLIAMMLIFAGIFRIAVALSIRYHNWIWLLLSGVINVLLGVMIWKQWPLSGLWVIGLFVGIDMIFNGWTLVMLGLGAKNLTVDE